MIEGFGLTRKDNPFPDLDEEDRLWIACCFHDTVEKKLKRLNARTGNLRCDFAGEAYRNWTLRFESAGSGFQIVELEYDEEAETLDLDP